MTKPRSRSTSSKTSRQITLTLLNKLGACREAVDEFNQRKIIGTRAILQALIDEKRWDWFSWIAVRLMTHKQKVKWTIFCAEQVIEIFEKKYPNDDRPRKAIEAARAWLKKPSEKSKNAATNAAYAAAYAANATNAATYAANAAYAAAYAANATNAATNAANAANAAYAAAYAAYAAANAAANAANAIRTICANEALRILRLSPRKSKTNANKRKQK